MNRPLHIWSLFAICTAVLLGAVTWVTATALRLERAQAEAQRQAEFEEKVRLTLWRMDSLLAPLIAQESSRPYFNYNSLYPVERAYNRMFNELQQGEVLVPSPLLTQGSSNILLHFQLGPEGKLGSPQVPSLELDRGGKGSYLPVETAATYRERLAQFEALADTKALLAAAAMPGTNDASWISQTPAILNTASAFTNAPPLLAQQRQGKSPESQQVFQNNAELQARAQNYQRVANAYAEVGNQAGVASHNLVSEGPLKPTWFGNALVLVRRVKVGGSDYVQGCWIDWPALQHTLLDSARDLLPNAKLEPIRGAPEDQQARLLASLPAKLVPGVAERSSNTGISPMVFALIAAWACMLVAAVAVGVLLHGVVSLSERRGAFVSAVTHELRTPLTTFKMYSEMLAGGMVCDESKRQQYLATLCSEANRLSHLVENVLAYARLERGSARSRVERLSLSNLIERTLPRLKERAAQAGMEIVVDADDRAQNTVVHVDGPAVEQILFNLVDNACKYAFAVPPRSDQMATAANAVRNTPDNFIHLEALPDGKFAMLRVRDHGRGISAEGAKRLFKPFSKSAQEAAYSAPGVGLGLALCRGLSRSIGGDLRFHPTSDRGACFELRLPISTGVNAALSSI